MKNDVAIIIPAYNPDEKLEKIVSELKKNQYSNIIVIDDGSSEKVTLSKIERQIKILEHKQNLGKGQAIKTGISYICRYIKNIQGILIIDADGQHQIEDVNKIYQAFQKEKNSLILGSRKFDKKVPLRSRIGNKIMTYIIRKKYQIKLRDTQTGLRLIPKQYFKEILQLPGDRFEYEMYMILYCIKNNVSIKEIEIKTIYINKNKSSHYQIIKDSLKIFQVIHKDS